MLKYLYTLCLVSIVLTANTQNLYYEATGSKYKNRVKQIGQGQASAIHRTPLNVPSAGILIQGLTNFLVDRTKQELNLAFVAKFKKQLTQNEYLTKLFPKTTTLLLNSDLFNRSIWGEQLKNTGREDLTNLPLNLHLVLKPKLPKKQKATLEVLFIVYKALLLQEKGIVPLEIFRKTHEKFGFKPKDKELNINKAISLAYALSECFLEPDHSGYVSSTDIHLMSNQQMHTFINTFATKYETLLRNTQINIGITGCSQSKNLYHFFTNISDTTSCDFQVAKKIFTYASELSNNYEAIKQAIARLNSATTTEQKITAFSGILNGVKNIFEIGYELVYFANPNQLKKDAFFEKVQPYIDRANELAQLVLRRNYAGILVALSDILTQHLQIVIDKKEKNWENLPDSNRRQKKVRKQACKKFIPSATTLKKIIFWGGLLAEVASLDSATKVSDIIKKHAAPVGSYRVKRQARVSLTLNAFPGIFGGLNLDDRQTIATGLTVPIGLSLNYALTNKAKSKDFDFYNYQGRRKFNGQVLGLYLQVIDIAAPFIYQWDGGNQEGFTDQIQWQHVFAPGAFLSYGFANIGLTLMAGVQRSPSLIKITNNDLQFGDQTWRLGLTLTYDIPIFTLFKKSK